MSIRYRYSTLISIALFSVLALRRLGRPQPTRYAVTWCKHHVSPSIRPSTYNRPKPLAAPTCDEPPPDPNSKRLSAVDHRYGRMGFVLCTRAQRFVHLPVSSYLYPLDMANEVVDQHSTERLVFFTPPPASPAEGYTLR